MAKYGLRVKARKLRRDGRSIKKIAKYLNVSSGSVSMWCRDIQLTPEQMERITIAHIASGYIGRMKGATMNKQKRLDVIERYRVDGLKDIGEFLERDLFLFGLGIYARDGYTHGKGVGLATSDSKIITLIMRWFREICHVAEKDFSCEVGINEIHKDRSKIVEKYWSDLTGVPLNLFKKINLKKIQNKKIYENHDRYFGTLAIRIRKSSDLKYRILGWLDGIMYLKV